MQSPLAVYATLLYRLLGTSSGIGITPEQWHELTKDLNLKTYSRLQYRFFGASDEAGITPEQWNELAKNPDMLGDLRALFEGRACITYIIDLDAEPFMPEGWKVKKPKNKKEGGKLKFDPDRVQPWFANGQRNGDVRGDQLLEEIVGKRAMNANVLDSWLKYPQLVPEWCKEKTNDNTTYVHFWGTIYINEQGHEYVRYFYWDDVQNEGNWDTHRVSLQFGREDPAAVWTV